MNKASYLHIVMVKDFNGITRPFRASNDEDEAKRLLNYFKHCYSSLWIEPCLYVECELDEINIDT